MPVSLLFEGLIVARKIGQDGTVPHFYCLTASPRSAGQRPMLVDCNFEKTASGLPDKDAVPLGALVKGRGSNVAACECDIHLSLCISDLKIIASDMEQNKIIRRLYDDVVDFASVKQPYNSLVNLDEDLDLQGCLCKFKQRLHRTSGNKYSQRVRLYTCYPGDFMRVDEDITGLPC